MIPDKILSDLHITFGITPTRITPVPGGYLNEKWKLETADGCYLLKRFSPKRYSGTKLDRIEQALWRQKYLHEQGIPCPRVYDTNGTILRRIPTDSGETVTYMLMSFENGETAAPQNVTEAQMISLGDACARMHRSLSALDPTSDPYYPLHSADIVHRLTEHRRELDGYPDFHLPPQTDAILSTFDEAFFDAQKKQLCHEDFSADNLLFYHDSAVILDFDRGQYSFPLHDVGRALLSLAFDGTKLRLPLVRAFAGGYRRHGCLTADDLQNALRLTLACEFTWWIHPDYENNTSPKVSRFVSEMHFLMQNWDKLPYITQGV